MTYWSSSSSNYISDAYYTPSTYLPDNPTSTSIFNGVAPASATPSGASSQGSIALYKTSNCDNPLSGSPAALILGTCFPMPDSDIFGIKIVQLPSCQNNGTPLLVVSGERDCTENSTLGSSADGGISQNCLFFSEDSDPQNEVYIGSVQFICYGYGVVNVTADGPVEEGGGSAGFRPRKSGILGLVIIAMLIVAL